MRYASLTDLASGVERTRNFPLDRAYRVVHGLVDLLLAWRGIGDHRQACTIIARKADAAQNLATRFLAELARRGASYGIRIAAEHAGGFAWLDSGAEASGTWLDAATIAPLQVYDLSNSSNLAKRHTEILSSMTLIESHYNELLNYYDAQGASLEAAFVALRAICLYNHFGYYHEAGSFVDAALPYLDSIVLLDEDARWNYLGNIFQGLVMIDREDEAHQILKTHANPKITRPDLRARMHYLLAMVHLRYSKSHDLNQAERHLSAARSSITDAKPAITEADHAFLSVFIDNGVAFLRVRQGRRAEAIALCQDGYALLTDKLGTEVHRLHRSVLQYNIAQVFAALGDAGPAIEHYDNAIEMDPNYSEYYNESANILLGEGRYEEALVRYRIADRVSAPYPELFHNIGVCQARLENWEAAREAFDRSLDLNPEQPAVLLMRAETSDALGDGVAALADLDAVLALDASMIAARVNRAALRFEQREYAEALAEMNKVILLVD